MIGEKFVTRAFFSYFSLLWYRLYDLTLTDAKCYNESRLCKIRKASKMIVCCLCILSVCEAVNNRDPRLCERCGVSSHTLFSQASGKLVVTTS